MSIGVVIPAYDRKQNLALALEALARQTSREFHVVVSDDGSTDGTRATVEQLAVTDAWRNRLRCVDCGPHRNARPGRARNLAVADLSADRELFVMLDSDVLLAEHGIAAFRDISRRHPGAVIMGITEWLPPLPLNRIRRVMRESGLNALRSEVPQDPVRKVEGTYVGPELRLRTDPELFSAEREVRRRLQPEWALASNSGYPVELFRRLGGFDEFMTGYGYEDIELGVRARAADACCVICPQIWSLHVWHKKAHPETLRLQIQRNIDYMLRKHGPWKAFDSKIDWSVWWHYHRLRGGRIFSVNGGLWVLNCMGTHKLKLEGPEWTSRLGFSPVDVAPGRADSDLSYATDMGAARLTPLDGGG